MKYILKNKEVELTAEEVQEIVKQNSEPKEEKKVGIAIMSRYGGIKFQSTKTTYKEAVEEAVISGANLRGADLSGADLRDANLRGADLSDAELNCAKFYGRGVTIKIKKANLKGFLGALGFVLEE
jgi:hypothetical protein